MQRELINVQTAMSAIDKLLYAGAPYPKEPEGIDLIALLTKKKHGKDQEIVECLWGMIKNPEVLTNIFGLPESKRPDFLNTVRLLLGLAENRALIVEERSLSEFPTDQLCLAKKE